MIELAAVATVTILAVVSPGADFAMISRNSLLHGRSAGLLSSLGVAVGVQLHVCYTMLGVGLLLTQSPGVLTAVKLCGAFYLVYVGWQTFGVGPLSPDSASNLGAEKVTPGFDAFKTGFLTNALNPKTTLFVVSVYTQVVDPATSLALQILYGLFMSVAHLAWFAAVSVFLSSPAFRARLLARQRIVNRAIGAVLALVGVWLAFSSLGGDVHVG